MPTLDNGTNWTGTFTLTKKTGTVLTLSTDDSFVDKDVKLTFNVKSGTGVANSASADADVVSDETSRNISGSVGTKASTAPSSGYYLRVSASGSGSSKVTTAGWLATGALPTASTTATCYFPVTSATITMNTPTVNASGLVTATSTITAGYTPADTKSKTLQLSTQGAQTITPTTTDQTIASGKYLTGVQTIKGDANLIPANIKSGVEIFGVLGTHEGGGTVVERTLDSGGGTIVTITSLTEVYTPAEEATF